jgi:hypothetical protein
LVRQSVYIETRLRFTSIISPETWNVFRNVDVSSPVRGIPLQKSDIGITAAAPRPTIGKKAVILATLPRKKDLPSTALNQKTAKW